MTRHRLLLLIALALLMALAGGAVFFSATQTGLRLLWPHLVPLLPGELEAETVEGRLVGPIRLRGLRYRRDETALAIASLDLDWRPGALLFGKLRITQLHADDVALALPPPSAGQEPASFTVPQLPLVLHISDARLGRIGVRRGDAALVAIEVLEAGFRLDARALEIDSLGIRMAALRLGARGRITLAGDMAADLHTDWSLTLPDLPQLRGGGRITGGLAALHLDQRLETPASARLQAVVRDLPAQPHWEARLELEETDARRIKGSWPALALTASAEAQGDFNDWAVTGDFRLRQERYGKLDGAFTLRHTPEFWMLERLELRLPEGPARLNASAQYPAAGTSRKFKLDAAWRELAWPLAGEARITSRQGQLRLTGTPERYTLSLAAAIAGENIPPGDWSLRGRGDTSRLTLDRIEAHLLDGRLAGNGRLAWRPGLAWQLTLAGEALDPGRHWHDWPGRLAFKAEISGEQRQDRPRADVSINEMRGELRGQPFTGGGALRVDGENYRLEDFRLDLGKARLRATGLLQDRWDVRWEARLDNLAALSSAQGALDIAGRVTGPRATPQLTATARLRNFTLPQYRLAPLDVDMNLDVETDERGLAGRLRLVLPDGDSLEAHLRLPGFSTRRVSLKSQPLAGELNARLRRLDPLSAFIPEVEDTSGELRARLAFAGTLGDPRITGRVTLADGAAQVPRLGLHLSAITLTAESEGRDRIRFDGRLRSGGELRFTGRMQWPAEHARDWSAELGLQGERVEVAHIPEARVLVTPDLRLRVRPRRVDLEGELAVPEAEIEPLPIGAVVPVSHDVVVVNAPEELAPARAPWDFHSQVRLTLGDKVRFRGFGLSGRITGGVTVSDAPEKPTTARGELAVVGGKYLAYGRDLEVERGRLLFAGGPVDNPGIDARAVRRSGEVLAGISVRGTLRSPVLTLFSEPPMSQEDALSYLILGQPLQQAGSAEGRTLLGAVSALALTGGDMLARRIGSRFGFEEVAIQTGDTPEEAAFVVGRYLSPKLYVSYSVGLFEQINLLRLRYQLSRRWTVQTETGTYSGGDLFYTIER